YTTIFRSCMRFILGHLDLLLVSQVIPDLDPTLTSSRNCTADRSRQIKGLSIIKSSIDFRTIARHDITDCINRSLRDSIIDTIGTVHRTIDIIKTDSQGEGVAIRIERDFNMDFSLMDEARLTTRSGEAARRPNLLADLRELLGTDC